MDITDLFSTLPSFPVTSADAATAPALPSSAGNAPEALTPFASFIMQVGDDLQDEWYANTGIGDPPALTAPDGTVLAQAAAQPFLDTPIPSAITSAFTNATNGTSSWWSDNEWWIIGGSALLLIVVLIHELEML